MTDKKQRNKNILMIAASIIIAIVLWAVVVTSENPVQTRTFSNVSVDLLNANVLEASGLTVAGADTDTVDIVIEGNRSALRMVNPEDVVASVDVASFTEGDQYADVTVHVPSGVAVSSINPSQIRYTVESIVTEDRNVSVNFTGSVSGSREAYCTSISTETVSVSGAVSRVAEVDCLQADVNTSSLSSDPEEFEVDLTPVDAEGIPVDGITVSVKRVNLTAVLYSVKTVNLNVTTVGSLPSGLELSSIEAPDTVRIVGPESDIDSITEVDSTPVNLSSITSSTELELDADISGDVHLSASNGTIKVTVTVKTVVTKNMDFSTGDIQINGLSQGFGVTFAQQTLSVKISGTESEVSRISSDDLTLSIDCSSMGAGTHTQTVTVTLSSEASESKVSVEAPEAEFYITN